MRRYFLHRAPCSEWSTHQAEIEIEKPLTFFNTLRYLDPKGNDIFHNILIQRMFLEVVFQCLGEISSVFQRNSIDNDCTPCLASHGPGNSFTPSMFILLTIEDVLQWLHSIFAIIRNVEKYIVNVLWLLPGWIVVNLAIFSRILFGCILYLIPNLVEEKPVGFNIIPICNPLCDIGPRNQGKCYIQKGN